MSHQQIEQLQLPHSGDDDAGRMKHRNNIKRRDLFEFIRLVMRVAGAYPLELERFLPKSLHILATIIDYVYLIHSYINLLHLAILHVATLYLYFNERDLEFVVNILIQAVIFSWAFSMKFYMRQVKPKGFRYLMDYVNFQYRTRSDIGFTYVTMDESWSMSVTFMKVFAYSALGTTLSMLLLPLAYGDRSLPLNCWYPIDYKQTYVYEFLYINQAIAQVHVATAFISPTGLFMIFALLLCGQYDVLFCSLKNIMANVYIQHGADINKLRELQQIQRNADAELEQYYCAKEEIVALENIAEFWGVENTKSKATNFYPTFKSILVSCVDHHRYIMKALIKLEELYYGIWLFKTGEVALVMCLVLFVSVKSTTANTSFMKVFSTTQYMFMIAIEMLIISYAGQIIDYSSQRCGDAILRSPWYFHLRDIKNDFLLFILNGKRSFKLSAGKIFVLNVDRFRSIMTTAFSFLTLLQKMDQRKA